MSDKTSEAAERLRRLQRGESIQKVYDDEINSGAASAGLYIDRALLADAWLAEHLPDDDEPIDAKRRTRWKVADNFYVYACGADVWLEDEVDLRLIELPMVKTLLQLRLLLRALNPERGQP